ncbi:MAG TPA: fused MFS/spermidine synthase [Rhizomicrobium sp.]|nr:fused MFS/spermidine synthase [Rhizomicrobium sp.]
MITVDEHISPLGTVTIFRTKSTGSLVYKQGGCCQSEADNNGVSLASYIHAIFGLILQTPAQNILLIGCGGGTLGTMLARRNRKVTAVDVNPAAFTFARQYFDLPESVDCRVADGRDLLLSDGRRYDAIVLDAFEGDRIPYHLQSPEFFALAGSRLTSSGAVFANVYVKHDLDATPDRFASRMAHIWPNVRLLDSQGWRNRNAIAMAGDVGELNVPALLERPQIDADEIEAELATMRFRNWKRDRSSQQ